jgi:hypothetical protein
MEVEYTLGEDDLVVLWGYLWDLAVREKRDPLLPRKGFLARGRMSARTPPDGALCGERRYRTAVTPAGYAAVCESRVVDGGVEWLRRDEVRCSWPQVTDIHPTAGHAVFLVAAHKAFVLPASAFPDVAAFRAFVDAALDFQRAAKMPPPRDGITATPKPPGPGEAITR